MNKLFEINDYELLSQKAYRILKTRIIKGDLKPGEKLLENKIAEQLGVSRTPVREALRELTAEGFVETTPNQAIIVSTVTFDEIWDLLQIRGVLEGLAAKVAAKKISPEKIEKFNKIIDQMKYHLVNKSTSKKNILNFSKLDIEFHDLILNICGNRWLIQIHNNLKNHIERFRIRSFSIPGTFSKSLNEHCKILDAIKKGDSELAEKLSKIHMEKAYENISKYETTKKRKDNMHDQFILS
jgi:DNA-binding GntR family transcriptional regulator